MVGHKTCHLNVNEEFFIIFNFQINYILYWRVSLWEWNPNQLLIYEMEVNICIGFWALKLRCTQHELCGIDDLQKCKETLLLMVGGAGQRTYFDQVQNKRSWLPEGCKSRAPALIPFKGPFIKKLVGGALAYGKEGSVNQWAQSSLPCLFSPSHCPGVVKSLVGTSIVPIVAITRL